MVRRGKRLVPSCSFLRNRNLPKHCTRDESGQLLLLQGEKSSGLQHTVMGPGDSVSWTRHQLPQAFPIPQLPHTLVMLCHLQSPQGHGWHCIGWLVDLSPKNIACCRVTESIWKLKLNLWISFSWTRKQRDLDKIGTFDFFQFKTNEN